MLEQASKNKTHYGIYFFSNVREAPNMKTFGVEDERDRAFDEVLKTGIIYFGNKQIQVVNARKFVSTDYPYFDYELIRKQRKEEANNIG